MALYRTPRGGGAAEPAMRLLGVVAALIAGQLVEGQLLEGSCAEGVTWATAEAVEGAICAHMPAAEMANCATGGVIGCTETAADSVPADAGACAAVTELGTAAACEAVMTAADSSTRACTYRTWDAATAANRPQAGGECLCLRSRVDVTDPAFVRYEVCPEGNEHGGTVCQDHTTHPDRFVEGFFACECQPGFSGALCAVDRNECDPDPCANGGACSEVADDASGGAYTCACRSGYAGEECQRDVDECASQPCLNGGVCADSSVADSSVAADAFSCACVEGWKGETCSEDIAECDQDACRHGAEDVHGNERRRRRVVEQCVLLRWWNVSTQRHAS